MRNSHILAKSLSPSLAVLCLLGVFEMLDSQLPTGTAKSRVSFYLSSQGFPLESTGDPHAIVAIIHHVDTDTLQPSTARVTFRFDAGDNLKSYELVTVAGSSSQR